MKNEIERLINGRGLKVNSNKNLTENLRDWRTVRNITKADYLTFVGNVLEELMEPLWSKNAIEINKQEILDNYFKSASRIEDVVPYMEDIIDAIQDIQVFCINETELMGYDNIKCNDEVFNVIDSREQDPIQKAEWLKNGAVGKWKKNEQQKKWSLYEADYECCKL